MGLCLAFVEMLQATAVAAPVSSSVSVNLTVSDILMVINALGMFGNIAVSLRGKK